MIQGLNHVERIMQKNLKILLSSCEMLEQSSYSVKDKKSIADIIKVVEQITEKSKC